MNISDLDTSSLYLYKYYTRYKIGTIKRINKNSIIMNENDYRITEKNLQYVYKLNEEEKNIYNNELIKNISKNKQFQEINNVANILAKIHKALSCSDFVEIKTNKLQQQIDNLSEILDNFIPKCFEICNKKFSLTPDQELKREKEESLELIYTAEEGSNSDIAYANLFLKKGQTYKVKAIRVNSWNTDIFLEDMPDMPFNSVLFKDKNGSDDYLEPYLEEYRKRNNY